MSNNAWPQRLWSFDKHYQYIGGAGGAGVGYGAPAALGAAVANKKYGRLSVNIQNDGDLMYTPGVLWTSAHHSIPLLTVMHNNRTYHQEMMHLQRMANRHQRVITTAEIGKSIKNPNIAVKNGAFAWVLYKEPRSAKSLFVGSTPIRASNICVRGLLDPGSFSYDLCACLFARL